MLQNLLGRLIAEDHQWFYKINAVWTAGWLDQIMPVITDLHKEWWFSLVLAPLILIIWIYKGRLHAVGIALCCLLAFAIADAASYRLIKPHVQRERPSFTLQNVQLRTNEHSGFSFPSNHAANMFAIATVLSFFALRWKRTFFGLAALIAYSRVYVGVHFPLDVIGGAILGIISGKLALEISFKFVKPWRRKKYF